MRVRGSDLINGPQEHFLYRNVASFKMAVDLLAQMLPSMVDGLAQQCELDERRRVQLERLMHSQPQMWLLPE